MMELGFELGSPCSLPRLFSLQRCYWEPTGEKGMMMVVVRKAITSNMDCLAMPGTVLST